MSGHTSNKGKGSQSDDALFRIFMSISVNKFVSLYYRIIYKQLNTLSITLRSTAKDTSYIMPGVMISCTHSEVQLNKTMRLLLFT